MLFCHCRENSADNRASKEMGQGVDSPGPNTVRTSRRGPRRRATGPLAAQIRKLRPQGIDDSRRLRNIDGLPAIVERTVAELGGLDILVNLAGSSDSTTSAAALNMTRRNGRRGRPEPEGADVLSQAAARVMKERGGGSS